MDKNKTIEGKVNGRDSNENRLASLMNNALQINLVREAIIGHAVTNAAPKDLAALRLVQRAWLKDVSKMLRKSRKPLYQIQLNGKNSLGDSVYVQENQQKILDHFVSTVALSSNRMEDSVPPFSLKIEEDFFHNENHNSFSSFLTGGTTAGLVELEVLFPKNGGCMDLLFSENALSLPMLRKLSILFSEEETTQAGHDLDLVASVPRGSNAYFLPFLQAILHGAIQLKVFVLQFNTDEDIIPNGIRFLILPNTLTAINLECELTSAHLNGLAANSLPNLKNLRITFSKVPFSDGLIFRVLDKFKKTLRRLDFDGISYYEHENIPRNKTHFCFPVMDSLEVFSSSSIHAAFEPEFYLLQTFLPKLDILSLRTQTVDMFRKWTDNACFTSVTKLTVGLVDGHVSSGSNSYDLTVRLEEMQLVHRAFPNVSVLYLNVTGEETSGLKYLFMEMKQLKELTINVKNSHRFTNSNHWDSLLTGVPIQVVETLVANPQLLEYFNVELKQKENPPSIRNLTALELLFLCAEFSQDVPIQEQKSLISDVAFNFALLKMPYLRTLYLTGRFIETYEIRQVWEAEKRTIVYRENAVR